MDFNIHAFGNHPEPFLPFFPDLPFRDGFPGFGFRGGPDLMHHEAIHREIEKARIREEIFEAEMVRRRILEEEVRMEMMMEREIAMRRQWLAGAPCEERMLMQYESRFPLMNPFETRLFEDRLAFGGSGSFEKMQLSMLPVGDESKPLLEVNKDKVIFLAKPNPNLCGTKRKAVTPATIGLSEVPPIVSKKKVQEEWSCAICQVTATSERGLTEHLQGKKHKTNEACLRSKRSCKNTFTAPDLDGNKLTETTAAAEEESGEQEVGDSLTKTDKDAVENDALKDSKEENLSTVQKVGSKKNNIKFWCEMCQVGTHSIVVHEQHKKGKKHIARLQKLSKKNSEHATAMFSSGSSQKKKL